MGQFRKAILVASLAALVIAVLPCHARAARSDTTMLINERGVVEVVDRWSGLSQVTGTFDYFSAAQEIGVIPVDVTDHGFTVAFQTRSYLRYEDGALWFATPDYYYAGGPLDVDLTLTFPPNMSFVESRPAPAYRGDGVLRWELRGAVHEVVMARFELTGPFTALQPVPEAWELDESLLGRLHASELPRTPNEVLSEFELVVAMARASGAADDDFLRVLDKLGAKFYYVMSIYGLLNDRTPGGAASGEVSAIAQEQVSEEQRRRNEKVHGYW